MAIFVLSCGAESLWTMVLNFGFHDAGDVKYRKLPLDMVKNAIKR